MALYSGPAPTIPNWLMLNSGKPSAEELSRLRAPRVGIAARNTAIPILYGRERVEGRVFYAQIDKANGFLYVGYIICEGEADAIEAVLMDGVDVTTGLLTRTGAAINRYLGGADNSVADPLLKEANIAVGLPAYNDTLPGTCYVVIKVPRGASSGFPRLEAIVRGRKVYDPRKDSTNGGSGAHRLNDRATWQWSDNPTLCFADFSTQLAGWDVVWPSIVQNANYNDTLIGGEKKRTVGLLMEAQASASEWAQGFRVYMGAYLARENGAIRVVPDRADVIPGTSQYNAAIASGDLAALNAVGVAYHFGPDDIKAGSLSLKHRSQRNSPNSVIVEYTEARLVEGWRTETVQVDSPAIAAGAPRRNSKVPLVGIKDRAQAYREATERLNWFLSDLEGTFTAWDEGLIVQVGSIIAISHPAPIPLAAKLFRVVGHSVSNGRWSHNIAEYSPDMYSDVAVPPDDYVPPVPVDPTEIPDIVGLVAAEELFTYKDGTVRSRVRMAWSPDDSPYLQGYQVEAWVGTKLLYQTFTKVNVAYTDAIEELNGGAQTDVVVKVAAVYRSAMGRYTSTVVPVRGKQTPPPAITSAVASAGNEQVTLDWNFPSQERLLGTEVWVSTVNNLGDAVKKGTVPYPQNNATLTGLTADVPVYIWLRLVDQVGNNSPYYPANPTGGLTATPTKSTVGQELADEIAARMAEDARVAAEAAAALAAEASTRANAIIAANDRINNLADTVTQNAQDAADALLAQKVNLEGQITSLSTTMSSADIALGQRIDRVAAGMSQQFDYFKQWTFDTTIEGWSSNGGTPTVSGGWLRPFNNSNSYVTSPNALAMSGTTYKAIMLRLKRTGTPVWRGIVQWITDADQLYDTAKQVTIPEPAFDANGIAIVTIPDITWTTASPIRQVRLSLITAQTAANYIEFDWIAVGRLSPGASQAALQDEATARVNGDAAEATARTTLATQMRGGYEGTDLNMVTSGLIFAEKQARTTAVDAVASSVTSLQTQLGSIGGDNMLPNSSFETSPSLTTVPTEWNLENIGGLAVAVSYVDSPLSGGGRAVRLDATTTANGQWFGLNNRDAGGGSNLPRIRPNTDYVLSGYVRGTAGCTVQLIAQFRDAQNGIVNTVYVPTTTLTGNWQRIVLPVKPTGATADRVRVYVGRITSPTPQAAFIEIDNVMLQEGLVATQWVPSTSEALKATSALSTIVTGLDSRVGTTENSITALSTQYTQLTASINNIGGDNQLGNSSFENGTSAGAVPGWANNSGGLSPGVTRRLFADSVLPNSTRAWRWELDNVPTTGYLESYSNMTVKPGKVTPGERVTLSAYVRGSAGARWYLQIAWRDASNAIISYTGISGVQTLADENWSRKTFTTVNPAPANAASAQAYIRIYGLNIVGQWVEWDNVQMQVGSLATGYMPSFDELQGTVNATATALTNLDARVVATENSITSLSTSTTTLTNKMLGLRTLGDNLIANSDFGVGLEWWGSRNVTGGNTIVWGPTSGQGASGAAAAGVVITRGASASNSPYLEYNEGKWMPLRLGSTGGVQRQFRGYVWAKADTEGAQMVCRLSVRTDGASESQTDVTLNLTTSWAKYNVNWAPVAGTRTEFLPRFFAFTQGTSVSVSSIELYDVTEQQQVDAQATAITGLQSSVGTINGQITALSTSTTKLTAQLGNLTALRVIASASITGSPSGAPWSAGVRDASNTAVQGANRGFNLIPINADGTLGTRTTYDTYGSTTAAQSLADAITALPENQYFLIYTSDHVGNTQTTGTGNVALKNVMLDAGASTSMWSLVSGVRMYIFVGRRKLGPAAGIEVICPPFPGGANTRQDQWCEYLLQFSNGVPVGLDVNRAATLSNEANATAITDLSARVATAEGTLVSTSSAVTSLNSSMNTVLSGGRSMFPLGTFETYTDNQTLAATAGGTSFIVRGLTFGVVRTGVRGLEINVATNNAPTQNADCYLGTAVSAAPGRTYYIEGFVKLGTMSSTTPTSGTIAIGVSAANSSNTQVEWGGVSQNLAGLNKTDWVKVSGYHTTANANGVRIRPWVQIPATGRQTGVVVALDDLVIIDVTEAMTAKTAADAAASAVSSMQTQVSNIDGRVTANANAITSLSASIDGKANASVVVSLEAKVNSTMGGGGNLIINSTFVENINGWGWRWNPGNWGVYRDLAGTDWMPYNGHQIGMNRGGTVAPGNYGVIYQNQWIPVAAGKKYMFSCKVAGHRSRRTISILFTDVNGNATGEYTAPWQLSSQVGDNGGRALASWTLLTVSAVAPAGSVGIIAGFWADGDNQNDPYTWFTQPMLEEVPLDKTTPSPWSAGGNDAYASWSVMTDVNGYIAGLQLKNSGSTSNFRVLADKFEIVSPSGGQRLEYSGGNIRTYDGNGVLRVQMGVW